MFPRQRLTSRSSRLDIGFTLFAVFVSSLLLGWAVLSHVVISEAVATSLRASLGEPALDLPQGLAIAFTTIALWLAYELAYFLNHWLSHRWSVLWAFHKVHHSAESLSPLTIFRVHPVDSIAFYNAVAIVTGLTAGFMRYALGDASHPLTIAGTNVLMVCTILTIKHLQHSHAWISFTGNWGRLLLSPAHHQIHHSIAPEHHDRNFGATIAVFDWIAGTLCIPDAKRQHLVFGVDDLANPHSFTGSVLTPFKHALDAIVPSQVAEPAPTGILARRPADATMTGVS
jgi:sterol desaturase/sphingolipid hydroxylase (fatty acid hydroxylase superfamily)